MKTYLHQPTKILQSPSRGKVQKCLTQLWNISAFPTKSRLQVELRSMS